MKPLRNALVLLVLALVPCYAAQAHPACPDHLPGLELQHARLLDSDEIYYQKQAISNIVTLTAQCDGAVTFWSLMPRLIALYDDVDAADQALVLDAMHAVKDAYALNQLERLVRRSRATAQQEALWARLLGQHQEKLASHM